MSPPQPQRNKRGKLQLLLSFPTSSHCIPTVSHISKKVIHLLTAYFSTWMYWCSWEISSFSHQDPQTPKMFPIMQPTEPPQSILSHSHTTTTDKNIITQQPSFHRGTHQCLYQSLHCISIYFWKQLWKKWRNTVAMSITQLGENNLIDLCLSLSITSDFWHNVQIY